VQIRQHFFGKICNFPAAMVSTCMKGMYMCRYVFVHAYVHLHMCVCVQFASVHVLFKSSCPNIDSILNHPSFPMHDNFPLCYRTINTLDLKLLQLTA
jgi:hypothetical protein